MFFPPPVRCGGTIGRIYQVVRSKPISCFEWNCDIQRSGGYAINGHSQNTAAVLQHSKYWQAVIIWKALELPIMRAVCQ